MRVPSPQSAARVSSWLDGIEPKAISAALTALLREYPPLETMLDGIAEAAPYLWDLIRADPARFTHLLESDPDEAMAALLAETRSAAAAAPSPAEVMRVLRRMKAEAALLIALADIGDVWPVARVTAALTEIAETRFARCRVSPSSAKRQSAANSIPPIRAIPR